MRNGRGWFGSNFLEIARSARPSLAVCCLTRPAPHLRPDPRLEPLAAIRTRLRERPGPAGCVHRLTVLDPPPPAGLGTAAATRREEPRALLELLPRPHQAALRALPPARITAHEPFRPSAAVNRLFSRRQLHVRENSRETFAGWPSGSGFFEAIPAPRVIASRLRCCRCWRLCVRCSCGARL
jgi:hypothetical protein